MISGNHSIHTRNSLGAAQDDPAYSDSGSGYGRTIKVLQDGSDGKKTVHPTGQSELFNNTFTHYASSAVSAPVTKMSSGMVNVRPDNGLRLASHDLVACHISLERGHSAVFGVLNGMLMHSSVTPGLSYCRKQLDILKTKEPFDEQSFLELAELLRAAPSAIDGHQHLDKSAKIELLVNLYHQQKDRPQLQRQHAKSQLANLETIKQNFKRYASVDRLSCLPDPVPENETAQMKKHVDALDALLSSIDKRALDLLIQADDAQQGKMSKAAEAVQKCRNILQYSFF